MSRIFSILIFLISSDPWPFQNNKFFCRITSHLQIIWCYVSSSSRHSLQSVFSSWYIFLRWYFRQSTCSLRSLFRNLKVLYIVFLIIFLSKVLIMYFLGMIWKSFNHLLFLTFKIFFMIIIWNGMYYSLKYTIF